MPEIAPKEITVQPVTTNWYFPASDDNSLSFPCIMVLLFLTSKKKKEKKNCYCSFLFSIRSIVPADLCLITSLTDFSEVL